MAETEEKEMDSDISIDKGVEEVSWEEVLIDSDTEVDQISNFIDLAVAQAEPSRSLEPGLSRSFQAEPGLNITRTQKLLGKSQVKVKGDIEGRPLSVQHVGQLSPHYILSWLKSYCAFKNEQRKNA